MNTQRKLIVAMSLCAAVTIPNIASATSVSVLQARDLDGDLTTVEAYYDPVADLTWLQDANASGVDMTASEADLWLADLNLGGVTGWRIPIFTHNNFYDPSCQEPGHSHGTGYNCTGHELGDLFYNVLGGVAGSSIAETHNDNYDLFSNILPGIYLFRFGTFNFNTGWTTSNEGSSGFVEWWGAIWVVHDGDVGVAIPSAVPIPAAAWLFGSGLLGLIGVSRRKQ